MNIERKKKLVIYKACLGPMFGNYPQGRNKTNPKVSNNVHITPHSIINATDDISTHRVVPTSLQRGVLLKHPRVYFIRQPLNTEQEAE